MNRSLRTGNRIKNPEHHLDVSTQDAGPVNQAAIWPVPLKFRMWATVMPLWAGIAYGYGEEAARLAANLVRMLETDLAAHGCLHEYYDPESGHGLTHPGFLNWNSLAVALSEPDLRAARREDP